MPLLLVLCFSGFASSITWRAVDPMLPVMAGDLGVSLHEAALLSSAFAFPYALMQFVLGPLGDAFGKSLMIRLSLAIVALSLTLTALAPSYGLVLGTRVLAGAFAGGLTPMSLALIGDRIPIGERQVAIGRYLVASIFGQVFGAAASGMVVELIGWRAVFAVASAIVFCVAAIAFRSLSGRAEPRTRLTLFSVIGGYRSVLANPLTLVVCLTVACEGALVIGQLPFITVLVMDHGAAGPFEAGLVIAAFAAGGVLYGFAVRRLLALLGQTNMMRAGGLLGGIGLMATLAPVPWPVVAGCFLFIGFGFYMLHNTMQTRATELAPESRGSAFAVVAACFFLGQGFGPVIGGAVVVTLGSGFLFFGAGTLFLVLAFGIAQLLARRPMQSPT